MVPVVGTELGRLDVGDEHMGAGVAGRRHAPAT
jgi:hypothetical protein